MTLGELIRNISTTDVIGGVGVEIKGVEIDSRRVSEGCLFVAMFLSAVFQYFGMLVSLL